MILNSNNTFKEFSVFVSTRAVGDHLSKLTPVTRFPNSMDADQYLAFANRFFHAYSKVDTKAISHLLAEDVYFEHHGRFKGQGKGKLLEQIENLSKAIPGRYYAEPIRWAVNGDFIFIEHRAYGTPVVDIELFGWKQGESVIMDCCTILVLKDGRVVEWHDYA